MTDWGSQKVQNRVYRGDFIGRVTPDGSSEIKFYVGPGKRGAEVRES